MLIQKNQVTIGLIQLATHSFWAKWDRSVFPSFGGFFQINFKIIRTSVFQLLYRVVGKQHAQINRLIQNNTCPEKTSAGVTGTLEKSGFPVPSCSQNLCYSDAATQVGSLIGNFRLHVSRFFSHSVGMNKSCSQGSFQACLTVPSNTDKTLNHISAFQGSFWDKA